jgi:Asp-tRNA(Asn)/Glu-tRNA(Gln) amidotransferase A subunit family amidase
MAKYLDDLVLTYSLMTNDTELYSSFSEEQHERSSKKLLKLGVAINFLNRFVANGISYLLDDEVKLALNKAVDYFNSRSDKIEVIKFSLSADEINKLTARIGSLFRHVCTTDCSIEAANGYLNDSHRFNTDSPYRSFEQLAVSPLLSQSWSSVFKGLVANSKPLNCKKNCEEYNKDKEELISYYLSLGQVANVDAILLPSVYQLPFLQNTSRPANSSTTLITLATCTGFPVLNIPVGFSIATKASPQGLPIGAALIGQPKSLLNIFKIAKLYEEKASKLKKLPFSTPDLETRTAVNRANCFYVNLSFIFISSIASLIHQM